MESVKECKNCGSPFEPTCHISKQKFCSNECRVKYNNAKRYFGGQTDNCPQCSDVLAQTGEKGRRRRFCSDRCRVLYHQQKRLKQRQNQERPKQVCPNCGKEFQPEWERGQQRRFCCDSCRIEWWKEYHRANQKEDTTERKCANCGQDFRSDRWHGGEYCSRKCYLQSMSKTHTKIICEWCGEEFTAFASASRKYCSFECSVAARHKQNTRTKARRRITYHTPEEWQELLKESTRKAERDPKRGRRVFLVCGVTSMYTGLDGLLGIIRYQLNHNPFDGNIYVFCDSMGTMLKYLHWDGAGFCMGKRRAQSGSYPWPPSDAGAVMEISEKEFDFLRSKSIVPTRVKKSN